MENVRYTTFWVSFQPYSQILDCPKNLAIDKLSSLFWVTISYEKGNNIDTETTDSKISVQLKGVP
jgi:hypothetical protein